MSKVRLLIAALAAVVIATGVGIDWARSDSKVRAVWQASVAPGALSQSHAFLSNQCTACHTPVAGVEPTLCITCHANNTALLQRQPTVFHASIQVCSGCHAEHQATVRVPTTMDHSLLARVGHQELAATRRTGAVPLDDREVAAGSVAQSSRGAAPLLAPAPAPAPGSGSASAAPGGALEGCGGSGDCSAARPIAEPLGARRLPVVHPGIAANESMLECVSCHASKDRHQGLLGTDCAQCHATTQWTIAKFVHPSARSTECAQCHKPPPSHNMMHFSMMSAPLARQPNAKVDQCFLCHQTTSWNDIKGVGVVKHH